VQTNLERYKKDLSKLIALGNAMHLDLEIQAIEFIPIKSSVARVSDVRESYAAHSKLP
jgi:hypothetical protein